jgi:hypothetical protein
MKRNGLVMVTLVILALVGSQMWTSSTSAQQPAVAMDAVAALGRAISTQVVTLTAQDQRGEPRLVTGRVRFDRPVQAYWVSVVGADIQFTGTAEKQVNRQMFNVDPFAKIINGSEVEVSGKLGIRDGSGDWDDPYSGTITVAVTAVLGPRQ